GVEQSGERIRGTMVPAVHDDTFSVETVPGAKGILVVWYRLERVSVRPRRNDHGLVAEVPAAENPVAHETVEGDDERRLAQDEIVNLGQRSRRETFGLELAESYKLIRVHVHCPVRDRAAP